MAGNKIYDIAVVGYGPAGITAGIYSARKKLQVLLLGDIPGGEVSTSGEIENWPGGGETDGIALAKKMVNHLALHKDTVTIRSDKVSAIKKEQEEFVLEIEGGGAERSKAVIYAAGRHPRELGVAGEKDFKNKGVSYCATCDAPLFQDKTVAVIGGGNSGAEAVIMLQKIAKKIYLLHLGKELTADEILVHNFIDDKKVNIILEAETVRITGEQMVRSLVYKDAVSGEEKEITVDGIFVNIGAVPNTEPVKELVELNKYGAIKADRYGYTNIGGVFAAGDVTDIRDAQIVVAAGHGSSAALSAGDYLARQAAK